MKELLVTAAFCTFMVALCPLFGYLIGLNDPEEFTFRMGHLLYGYLFGLGVGWTSEHKEKKAKSRET